MYFSNSILPIFRRSPYAQAPIGGNFFNHSKASSRSSQRKCTLNAFGSFTAPSFIPPPPRSSNNQTFRCATVLNLHFSFLNDRPWRLTTNAGRVITSARADDLQVRAVYDRAIDPPSEVWRAALMRGNESSPLPILRRCLAEVHSR